MLSYRPVKLRPNPYTYRADQQAEGWVWAKGVSDMYVASALITAFPWSPIQWFGGLRLERNFVGTRLLALDFDKGDLLETLQKLRLSKLRYIVGTTKSHTDQANRFRVVFELEPNEGAPSLAAYQRRCQELAKAWGADLSCCDGARFFWPCREIIEIQSEGEKLPLGGESRNNDPRYSVVRERSQEANTAAEDRELIAKLATPLRHSLNPLTAWHMRQDVQPGRRHDTYYRWGRDCGEVDMTLDQALELTQASPTWRMADEEKREDLDRAVIHGFRKQRKICLGT